LWAFVCLVVARGIGDILADSTPSSDRTHMAPAAFPDAEAETFATQFARAYFEGSGLHSFLPDDLSDQAGVNPPRRGPGAKVAWAMVAREATLGSSRALITVAVSAHSTVRYLTVPVARDQAGGLVVLDLPALSPPPRRGAVAAPEPSPLTGQDAGPVGDVASRFLRTYIGGASAGSLAYYLAPGARVSPMPGGLRVLAVEQLDAAQGRAGRRGVRALVRVRDEDTGADLLLRYRLEIVKRGRWLVAGVAGGPDR
jgi:hypothetical protein